MVAMIFTHETPAGQCPALFITAKYFNAIIAMSFTAVTTMHYFNTTQLYI